MFYADLYRATELVRYFCLMAFNGQRFVPIEFIDLGTIHALFQPRVFKFVSSLLQSLKPRNTQGQW